MAKKTSDSGLTDMSDLKQLAIEIYEDLIESYDYYSTWPIEKYGLRLKSFGLDVSGIGTYAMEDEIKLYDKLESQNRSKGYYELADKYWDDYLRLKELADELGMEISYKPYEEPNYEDFPPIGTTGC